MMKYFSRIFWALTQIKLFKVIQVFEIENFPFNFMLVLYHRVKNILEGSMQNEIHIEKMVTKFILFARISFCHIVCREQLGVTIGREDFEFPHAIVQEYFNHKRFCQSKMFVFNMFVYVVCWNCSVADEKRIIIVKKIIE